MQINLPGLILIGAILAWSGTALPEDTPGMKPTMNFSSPALADRLRGHISHLALDIGERNVLLLGDILFRDSER